MRTHERPGLGGSGRKMQTYRMFFLCRTRRLGHIEVGIEQYQRFGDDNGHKNGKKEITTDIFFIEHVMTA